MMRTTLLATGILALGIVLGYMLFVLFHGGSVSNEQLGTRDGGQQQGGFKNNVLPTTSSSRPDSSFTTQSFNAKDVVIEK